MTHPTTARELFQIAYESRYTWDENFPGYSADVQLVQEDKVYTGQIRINHDLSVKVAGVADEQVQEGIYTQLRDIVTHRKRNPFEQSHGKSEFSLGQQDSNGATEILVKGDSMGSNYKIRGKEICQVSRVMGRMAFVIDTYETVDTGSGYVASRYDAVFRNSSTNEVTSVLKFDDTYEEIGGYYIMTKQIVQEYKEGNRTTTEFSYSNIKLLEPASV
ncbi:DUF3386 domain-containing protein [Aetokthonos hydrillicola Thurmond2011]|jgi:hypothetical protein|uniref:DUF3386 domain-containing protein n=1 Tax=Aetokthonos hydrillicola Thurmond2011 TaxID=2712845 RepID=A0AAP5MCQ9_9CYAN|nr:DUF3386 domain-containing protein [Aetokthonos hydrillicola]MBO3461701.1 DUF3386 domain-containing protein [Aetokthonos hydrillicola CCALA 1050]MBW4589993.1 DUF3386 domain-containing protein [Aetokthonos hydrillicola CCALA 1050]MDR9900575.1 DUF3386 domain-containing protein [Aetokthonos hydrillicola Thurmond2011]